MRNIPAEDATAAAYLQWVLDVASDMLDVTLVLSSVDLLADSRAMALLLALLWRGFGRRIQVSCFVMPCHALSYFIMARPL